MILRIRQAMGGVDYFRQDAPVIKERRDARNDGNRAHDDINGEYQRMSCAKFLPHQMLGRRADQRQLRSVGGKLDRRFKNNFLGKVKQQAGPGVFLKKIKTARTNWSPSPAKATVRHGKRFSIVGDGPSCPDHCKLQPIKLMNRSSIFKILTRLSLVS